MKSFYATASILLCLTVSVGAEGMLPGSKPAAHPAAQLPYVLVGDPIPADLTVVDKNGNTRPILSYKSTIEVLVLGFYSSKCPANQAAALDLQRFFEKYKDWNTVFLAISSDTGETLPELQDSMKQQGLLYKTLRDEGRKAADKLHVLQTPEILIIDEWGVLRYRGPLQSEDKKIPYARNAIDAVIGHIEAVPYAEPPLGQGCPIQ